MAIARNTPRKPKDAAAIEAFGAAAEARPQELPVAAPTPVPAAKAAQRPKAVQTAGSGPASSLVRWKDQDELRDRIKAYAKTERYSEQDVMIRALQLGMDQIENR